MNTDKRAGYITRDAILKLLSDDEIARVRTAETAPQLNDGDEYIDLETPGGGVRKASGNATVMGRVLPRKAVLEKTWHAVVALLADR